MLVHAIHVVLIVLDDNKELILKLEDGAAPGTRVARRLAEVHDVGVVLAGRALHRDHAVVVQELSFVKPVERARGHK